MFRESPISVHSAFNYDCITEPILVDVRSETVFFELFISNKIKRKKEQHYAKVNTNYFNSYYRAQLTIALPLLLRYTKLFSTLITLRHLQKNFLQFLYDSSII